MLPDLDEHGNLPPGIHRCSIDEVVARFGHGSLDRQLETAELRALVEWAREEGVLRLILGGSYVSDKAAPNDVDAVVLPGADYPRRQQPVRTSAERWPFLHVQVAEDEADLRQWAVVDFGTDRRLNARGVVEIVL